MLRKSFLSYFSAIVLMALCVRSAQAQTVDSSYLNATGNPNFSVNIPVPNGYINVANGDLHLEIPLAGLKQRGNLQLNERLVYDSRIWEIIQYDNYYWWPLNVPNSMAGWRFVKGNETGTISYGYIGQNTYECPGDPDGGQYVTDTTSSITWTDPSGTQHLFDAYVDEHDDPCTPSYTQQIFGGYATDASGYQVKDDGTGNPLITDSGGTQVYPQVVDRFGNYWSSDGNGNLIDDLGRTPVITTQNGNQTYYDVLAPNGPISNNGTRVRYIVTTESLTLNTAFDQTGVVEYQNNGNPPGSNHPNITAIQSVQLPDGSEYQFGYDSYGEITAMTLPTGGTVSFGWTNYLDSYQNVNRWLSSSTLDNYTTNYTPSVISQCSSGGTGCQEQVNVHRPSGDETVYTLTLNNGAWDTATMIYKGGAITDQPVFSDGTSYNFSTSCNYTTVCSGAQYVTKATENQTLIGNGNYQATQIQTTYANPENGQLTTWAQWDYYPSGSTPSSTPTRQINYGYTGYDLTSEEHYDQNGNPASLTTYNYTSTATATSGIVGHGTENAGGPYLTSVTKTSNFSSGSTITSYFTYDDTGSTLTSEDFNGNTTTYKHDPTDAFTIEVDAPIRGLSASIVSKASYDPSSGAILTSDDPNSVANKQAYTVHYSYEAVAGRSYQILYPDGGSTTYTYPTVNETDITKAQTSSVNIVQKSVVDGYGRQSSTSAGTISSTTTYDSNGRVYSVSNPNQGSQTASTDGVTYTSYDTLNRIVAVSQPDGVSSQEYSYSGNQVTTTDELGHERQITLDAFGEIASVTEADPATGTLDLQTVYQHDGLGNITCVEQHGNVSSTGCGTALSGPQASDLNNPWRIRRFYYDPLSRLLAAEIPEHSFQPNLLPAQNCGTPDGSSQWTDCYTYDANGNAITARNNTGATITSTYDAINRLVEATDSSSFQQTYNYDTGINGVGRLFWQQEAILHNPNPTGSYSKLAYDVMGRLTSETSGLGIARGTTVSATYDLLGDVTSITYPDGRVIQNGYDNLSRLTSVTYQQWGATPVGTTYWSSPSYDPPGELTAAQYGNGMQLQASFNPRQSITALSYGTSSATVFNKTYQWDRNATNLIQEVNQLNGEYRLFGYDNLNRLVSAADTTGPATASTGSFTLSGTEGFHVSCIVVDHRSLCTQIYDSGTVTVTVNGFSVSTYPGEGSTASTLAATLCSELNAAGSPVTATVNGATITVVSNETGAAANYALSSSSSQSDFTATSSGSTMTGGASGPLASGGLNQQYSLDAWGNLSQMGSNGFSQAINNQNQVASYTYDAAGRLLNDGSLTYTYDLNGMLVSSSDGATYAYDGKEQRVTTSIGTGRSNVFKGYYYFGGVPYAIYNGTAGLGSWTDLIYAGNQRIAEVAGTQTATPVYDVLDHVGSEVASVDSNGNILSSLDYTPFGQLISGSNSDGFVFADLLRDNSGLDHALMRQYSSATGRWITPDPYGGSYSFSDPQSFNRYIYSRNLPLGLIDPSGLQYGDPPYQGGSACGDACGVAIAVVTGGISLLLHDLFSHPSFHGNVKATQNQGKLVRFTQNSDITADANGTFHMVTTEIQQYISTSAYSTSYSAPLWTAWILVDGVPVPIASIVATPTVTYIPKNKTWCSGAGIGIATGTGEGITFAAYPSTNAEFTENVVSGTGWNFQAQPVGGAGLSLLTNSSGSLLGYSVSSSTGLSATYGWTGCRSFK